MALTAPLPISPAPGAPVSGVQILQVSPSVETPDPQTLTAQAAGGTAAAADATLTVQGGPQTLVAQAAGAAAGAADATLTATPPAATVVETFFEEPEHVVGSTPSQWSRPWSAGWAPVIEDLAASENLVMKGLVTQANRNAMKWNHPDLLDVADGEVLAILNIEHIDRVTAWQGPGVIIRGAGAETAANRGYTICFGFVQDPTTIKGIEVLKYTTNGPGTQLAQKASDWVSSGYTCLRVRFQGTQIRARSWAYGSAEPSTWPIDVTDAFSASGFVGAYQIGLTSSAMIGATYGTRYAYVGVTVGSGTVPVPASL